jgi:hypothetical protein
MSLRTTPGRDSSDKDQTILHIATGLQDPQRGEMLRPDIDNALNNCGRSPRSHQGSIRPGSKQQSEA